MAIKVVATQRGFYKNSLREEGDEFEVVGKEEVGSWMEVVKETKTSAK